MAFSDIGYVRIGKGRIKEAARVLSRAFQEDPVFDYFIPDPATRQAKSRYIFDMLVQYSVANGEVYASSMSPGAVAVWLPHNKVAMSLWNGVRNGGLPILLHLSPACLMRQLNASDCMCSTHDALAPYPHKYLYLLGSAPELRGKGYAGALMRPMLSALDVEGLPCYLDNTNVNNTAMYEHYGFRVIKEYAVPKTDVKIWAMMREPQNARTN